MQPPLESITQSRNYGDLLETWRVPDIDRLKPYFISLIKPYL